MAGKDPPFGRFDMFQTRPNEMVGKYGISGRDHVAVTGYSKGGNKAQYVTVVSANADLIDSCVALDGQGFSPEAVSFWKQYPDIYEDRRKAGALGRRYAGHVRAPQVSGAEDHPNPVGPIGRDARQIQAGPGAENPGYGPVHSQQRPVHLHRHSDLEPAGGHHAHPGGASTTRAFGAS